ncbi:MAG: tyrosine-protein kinase [Thermoleophilaceae bacterium]|jgi:capsular exopolysaccharide synthesis family protein|nr:tyrosine-protein kinase [Thermoleophilaceae bacterium]MEA2352961.1 tyrosine-protein kinase [Thermoleophilaceae bacterium]MEA2367416.1 tyrosine-protein kinase [Thermoleophilaceae bacterium]
MKADAPMLVLWRRKWIVLGVFLAFAITAAVVSKAMPKVYETDSTLIVSSSARGATFDQVQASQALARSFEQIVGSPNIAQLVATRLGDGTTKQYILDHTSSEPIPQTQLIKITAEDRNQARAKHVANAFAATFVDYARRNLVGPTEARISVADLAPFPTEAARPKPTLYTLIAGLLGLALGVGLALLRDRLDRRLRTPADVEARFEIPVLARVPRKGRSDASVSAFNEAYRILRTNLQFAVGAGRLDSVAITSGAEGEGKTTTVVQLAVASAEVGLRVAIVEADLRRPVLQERLLPHIAQPLRPGFSNYLVEETPLDQVIHSTGLPGVSLIPSGPVPPNPAALLETHRAHGIVKELQQEFDLVLVDCPPLNVAADASIVASLVDGVIVVVDLNTSQEDTVRDAVRRLRAVHATLIGLLLNRDRGAEVSRYDYYLSSKPKRGKRAAQDDLVAPGR